MASAKQALGLINDGIAQFEAQFKRMAGITLDGGQLAAYLKAVFPDRASRGAGGRSSQTASKDRENAARLFEEGQGNDLPKVRGTLWAAFNGVTGYVDHFRGNYTRPQRLRTIWFGKGQQIKWRAYRAACEWPNLDSFTNAK
jgi:hypothetical protein